MRHFSTFLLALVLLIFLSSCEDGLPPYVGNRPPLIEAIDITVNANDIDLVVTARDYDGDNLFYKYEVVTEGGFTLDSTYNEYPAPSSISLDKTGVVTGSVKVSVRDTKNGISTRTFQLSNDQSPFILAHSASKTIVAQGETIPISTVTDDPAFTFEVSTTDPGYDVGGITNEIINENIHKAEFTADDTRSGTATVFMKVTNNFGEATSQFEINVGKQLKRVRNENYSSYGNPYFIESGENNRFYVHMSVAPNYLVIDDMLNVIENITYTGLERASCMAIDESVNPPVFHSADYAVAGATTNAVKTFNLSTGDLIAGSEIPITNIEVLYILLRHDGTRLISSVDGEQLQLIDASNNVIPWGGSTAFFNPRQSAEHPVNHNIYVTARGNGQIRVYSQDGVLIETINSPIGFNGPHGICLDIDNDLIYISDTYNDRFQIFRLSDHVFLGAFDIPSGGQPRYITLAEDGKLFAAMAGNGNVFVYSYE